MTRHVLRMRYHHTCGGVGCPLYWLSRRKSVSEGQRAAMQMQPHIPSFLVALRAADGIRSKCSVYLLAVSEWEREHMLYDV